MDTGSEGSWMERESQGTINSAHQNQDQTSNVSNFKSTYYHLNSKSN
jgi:hypothetical protein